MLAVRDLRHAYGSRTVLEIDAFALPRGSCTALVGPNGSGKSTLLRILAGVERPRAGALTLGDAPVRTRAERLALRRRVTLVEQQPVLFDMTVRENLVDALRLRSMPRGPDGARVTSALEAVGAGYLADRHARELSGGEVQRVAIARGLLVEPDVLLLDEPLSAADAAARMALGDVLRRLHDTGTTVCLSSHLLEEAYAWSSRILTLVEGRLEQVTPENLFRVTLPDGTGSKAAHAGPLTLSVVSDRRGPAMVALPPDELLVSRQPFASSARNHFAGRVTAISEDGHGRIRLTVDVGTALVARITPESLRELDLQVGTAVVLTIKAMAVRVF